MASTQATDALAYPERLRARIAGRVGQVRFSAAGEPPRYEAELIVEKSCPATYNRTRALMTGLPAIESSGDFSEDGSDEKGSTPDEEFAPNENDIDRRAHPARRFPDEPPVKPGTRVLLVWHGQHSVPGIVAGAQLRCNGMLSARTQPARMYNPRYEIVPVRSGH
ncbi:asparaginase [Rothia sp. ZJ1223]|uniref:asparaginase n=1 Tax=Rothia sp. ZJ1223 TaxID=2811098 RepID=UPI001958111A|nr:asparaginase [Rothia sp. ZJ1223]MBM7050697.1 asparaginase [Rothia sp. ZJ1223]